MAGSKFDGLMVKKHEVATPAAETPPVGRPRNGKRSNDAYKRLTVLVPESDVKRMKRLLLDRDETDMSDYVAAALSEQLQRDEAGAKVERKHGHTK